MTSLAAQRGGMLVVIDDLRLDLIEDLRETILAREETSPSAPTLNRGGWRSGSIFSWADPCVTQLEASLRAIPEVERALRDASQRNALVGWAMVNRLSDHHPRHIHYGASVTGIYYVDPGQSHTPTVFETTSGDLFVEPAPGRVVLFPGDLWHRVPAHAGDQPRVTIAFEVRR